jgi:hypothetical protein
VVFTEYHNDHYSNLVKTATVALSHTVRVSILTEMTGYQEAEMLNSREFNVSSPVTFFVTFSFYGDKQ